MVDIKIEEADSTNLESQTNPVIMDSNLTPNPQESINPNPSRLDSELEIDSDSITYDEENCLLSPTSGSEITKTTSSESDITDNSDLLSDCGTPKASTFNPFAPASEVFALAPMKKTTREFRIPTRRKLNFDSCCSSVEDEVESAADVEDELIYELLFQQFHDLVLENQISDLVIVSDDKSDDGLMTPTLVPRLTGIAETCPDAPKRSGPEPRMPMVDPRICRQLEFDGCLV